MWMESELPYFVPATNYGRKIRMRESYLLKITW